MPDAPLRRSAKVLFHDPTGRTLLFQGCDPLDASIGTWWFAPGGGLEGGESDEAAAIREVLEETGQRIADLGPAVATTRSHFSFMNRSIHQESVYFTKATEPFDVDRSGWTDGERRSILDVRWWTMEELRSTDAIVWPENIVELLVAATNERLER